MKCSVYIATSTDGYIAALDGGASITSFINLELIDDMIITKIPILLGEGILLFLNITL